MTEGLAYEPEDGPPAAYNPNITTAASGPAVTAPTASRPNTTSAGGEGWRVLGPDSNVIASGGQAVTEASAGTQQE